jgi:hypothetical protein
MSPQSKGNQVARGLRTGAMMQAGGYVALVVSLLLKDAHAIAALLPLGVLLLFIGVVCWALAAFREARAKGMV